MTPKFYVQIYPTRTPWWSSRPSQWGWRAKAMNHEILATGETYHNLQDCKDTLAVLFGDAVVIKRVSA